MPTETSQPTSSPRIEAPPHEFMDAYYLGACALCDAVLGTKGEALDIAHHGRMLRLCSSNCRAAFERDPAAGIARADAVMIADQLPHYPLQTSLVDHRALGPRPIDFIWGNRLFRAVDAADRDAILADPVAAIRALDRAVVKAQQPTYAMPDKCPVQGDILRGDPRLDIVVANRMVRVCCTRCVRVVRARPYPYLAMVEYANRAARTESQPSQTPNSESEHKP